MENNNTQSFEELRLQELKDYFILDTSPDVNLDNLTKIASNICQTPIALVSLIDENRQWFKAKVGLDIQETPRDISFCTHAIRQNEIFIVENPSEDERFKNNPFVTGEPFVRFYAGMPLKSHNGYNIGTLCVIDFKQNRLDENKIDLLRALSKQVINYFEIYKKNRELILLRKSIVNDEKLKIIVNLSSGISHEINNPLSIILGRIYLLENKIKNKSHFEQEEALKDLNSISIASKRISYIIESLCNFSLISDNELFKICSLSDILNQVLILCEAKIINSGIYFMIEEIPNVKINCRPINFSHAIFSIITNAYESVHFAKDKWINIKMSCIENENRNNLIIRIIDSGNGIQSDVLNNILDPNYTKKFTSPSKSLNLNLASEVISDCGGKLMLDESNENNCFMIQMPVSSEE
ncbi:GAF domain-containing sensor histidine kinase [Fluviispira multicolorata]|uniref:histidine kinase n=1 Tax=Fluviispira multicolorata TaxID=2654512 RepID=A0A833JEM1_9BACT|nr:GAF domain-containing sensor histidine kinase [Fluviispira multicolorata]KAB8033285.1 GAF domain-containing protein [Fluviispira multicolorata]